MEGDNEEGFSITLRERRGKTPITEASTPPPFKRSKVGRKKITLMNQNVVNDELSYLNEPKFANARKWYLTIVKLNFGYK